MRARVVAPLVAAVLGIGCGVAVALAVPDDSATSDPLGLGIPLKNQGCSDDSLLVIGYGNSVALSTAVANSDHQGLRYLRSADSCDTVLGPEGQPTPAYVVYRGPYSTKSEPCEIRMSGDEPGSVVTRLRAGNEQLVKCPCEIPRSQAPHLVVGMDADQSDTLWIRALQVMFNDDDPSAFPRSAITGKYDERTSQRVQVFQRQASGKVTVPGEVDETTWGIITGRLCRTYDY
jgi:hypothetical protein